MAALAGPASAQIKEHVFRVGTGRAKPFGVLNLPLTFNNEKGRG